MKCWHGVALNQSAGEGRVIMIDYPKEDEKALIKILETVGVEIEKRENNR